MVIPNINSCPHMYYWLIGILLESFSGYPIVLCLFRNVYRYRRRASEVCLHIGPVWVICRHITESLKRQTLATTPVVKCAISKMTIFMSTTVQCSPAPAQGMLQLASDGYL